MAVWQFHSHLNASNTVDIPPDVAAQLDPNESVRIVLMTGDASDESDWQRLTADQFLKGYAPGDEIYDQLSPG